MKTMVEELDKYFISKKSVTYERFIFNICQQEAAVSIDKYENGNCEA